MTPSPCHSWLSATQNSPPDSCFGLLKQKFRKTFVQTLEDMANVVTTSAICNKVELVGHEDGIPIIPTYDWSSCFAENCNKITGIKQYQHFTVKRSKPGKIYCCTTSDAEPTEVNLLKNDTWNPSSTNLPSVIHPKGLDAKRQWYLYDQICPYCNGEAKNKTCPMPTCPKPCSSTPGSPAPPHPRTTLSTTRNVSATSKSPPTSPRPPPSKKQRVCKTCLQHGHNSRTCNRQ